MGRCFTGQISGCIAIYDGLHAGIIDRSSIDGLRRAVPATATATAIALPALPALAPACILPVGIAYGVWRVGVQGRWLFGLGKILCGEILCGKILYATTLRCRHDGDWRYWPSVTLRPGA